MTVDEITLCNVKAVACSDEPTEDNHPTQEPHSAL